MNGQEGPRLLFTTTVDITSTATISVLERRNGNTVTFEVSIATEEVSTHHRQRDTPAFDRGATGGRRTRERDHVVPIRANISVPSITTPDLRQTLEVAAQQRAQPDLRAALYERLANAVTLEEFMNC